jgi:hypothetical protein
MSGRCAMLLVAVITVVLVIAVVTKCAYIDHPVRMHVTENGNYSTFSVFQSEYIATSSAGVS